MSKRLNSEQRKAVGDAGDYSQLNVDEIATVSGVLNANNGVVMTELAAVPAVPAAGTGQVWLRNDSELIYTDDSGADRVVETAENMHYGETEVIGHAATDPVVAVVGTWQAPAVVNAVVGNWAAGELNGVLSVSDVRLIVGDLDGASEDLAPSGDCRVHMVDNLTENPFVDGDVVAVEVAGAGLGTYLIANSITGGDGVTVGTFELLGSGALLAVTQVARPAQLTIDDLGRYLTNFSADLACSAVSQIMEVGLFVNAAVPPAPVRTSQVRTGTVIGFNLPQASVSGSRILDVTSGSRVYMLYRNLSAAATANEVFRANVSVNRIG